MLSKYSISIGLLCVVSPARCSASPRTFAEEFPRPPRVHQGNEWSAGVLSHSTDYSAQPVYDGNQWLADLANGVLVLDLRCQVR